MNDETTKVNSEDASAVLEGTKETPEFEKPKTRQMLTLDNGQSHTADRWCFLRKKNKWVDDTSS